MDDGGWPLRIRSSGSVLQLRVVLRGVSPLVWRRLLISSDVRLADLHEVIQVAFGWEDAHLHRFRIHGREFGIYRDGGVWFDEDARAVPLSRFELRVGERFVYEYDFGDSWVHEIRVEHARPRRPRERVPKCVAGGRAGPPEDCGGPPGFMAWEDSHSLFRILEKLEGLAVEGLAVDDVDVVFGAGELHDVRLWLTRDRFDRQGVNRELGRLYRSEVPE